VHNKNTISSGSIAVINIIHST